MLQTGARSIHKGHRALRNLRITTCIHPLCMPGHFEILSCVRCTFKAIIVSNVIFKMVLGDVR